MLTNDSVNFGKKRKSSALFVRIVYQLIILKNGERFPRIITHKEKYTYLPVKALSKGRTNSWKLSVETSVQLAKNGVLFLYISYRVLSNEKKPFTEKSLSTI